jgi:tRNA/rRNA methyltransferase
MGVYFILVRPSLPENVGAAARALKTMGFRFLRLVAPCDHLCERARWVAHGSEDVLERARVYPDLAAALHDIDFAVGTTSKRRIAKHDYYRSDELLDVIAKKETTVSKTAIVFGAERTGLLGNELSLCDIASTVPMRARHPSLNLAQTVMVYAYELSPLNLDRPRPRTACRDAGQFRSLKHRAGELMQILGIAEGSRKYCRAMERLGALAGSDVRLMHLLCGRLLGLRKGRA